MSEIEKHFEALAPEYDKIRARNWYYYGNLKKRYKKLVPEGKRVLEVGCGTGEVLASLKPSFGVGVDISGKMIEIARGKFRSRPELQFFKASAGDFKSGENFDYIIMPDVIEHLEDVPATIRNVKNLMSPRTVFVISMANLLWEPVLWFAEKLKLKMEEGPHYRISLRALKKILQAEGLRVEEINYFLHIPVYIPVLSDFLNKAFSKIPFFNRLGLLIFLRLSQN